MICPRVPQRNRGARLHEGLCGYDLPSGTELDLHAGEAALPCPFMLMASMGADRERLLLSS